MFITTKKYFVDKQKYDFSITLYKISYNNNNKKHISVISRISVINYLLLSIV